MLAVNVYSISQGSGPKTLHTQAYKVKWNPEKRSVCYFYNTQEEMEENWLLWTSTNLDDTNLNMRFVDYGEVNNAQFDRGYSYTKYGETASFLQ